MNIELNNIYNCDCLQGLKSLNENSIDLTITSPPYDNLRTYNDKDLGDCVWNFDVFKPIAQELFRVTKNGGVLVWIVGDAVINCSETGSSFKQALYFMECGFKLHDTMIYEKNSSSFPARATSKRYTQIFEYMFVFTKGKIRNDIKLIADKKNKWAGWMNWGTNTNYNKNGILKKTSDIKPVPEFSLRTNIWKIASSMNDKTGHPAVFPEKLAEDHIISWTNENDIVLDPFMGSGTTAKMALLNNRKYIGFEINNEYYNNSIVRINKYLNASNNRAFQNVTLTDDDNNEFNTQYEIDKDLSEKTILFNNLVEQLNQYFNEQTLQILKNLKLIFQNKSNTKKVEEYINKNE